MNTMRPVIKRLCRRVITVIAEKQGIENNRFVQLVLAAVGSVQHPMMLFSLLVEYNRSRGFSPCIDEFWGALYMINMYRLKVTEPDASTLYPWDEPALLLRGVEPFLWGLIPWRLCNTTGFQQGLQGFAVAYTELCDLLRVPEGDRRNVKDHEQAVL